MFKLRAVALAILFFVAISANAQPPTDTAAEPKPEPSMTQQIADAFAKAEATKDPEDLRRAKELADKKMQQRARYIISQSSRSPRLDIPLIAPPGFGPTPNR